MAREGGLDRAGHRDTRRYSVDDRYCDQRISARGICACCRIGPFGPLRGPVRAQRSAARFTDMQRTFRKWATPLARKISWDTTLAKGFGCDGSSSCTKSHCEERSEYA